MRLLFRYSNARGVIVPGNSDSSSGTMTEVIHLTGFNNRVR
jgi:hypothetical protein